MERNVSLTVKTKDGSLVTLRADEPEELTARISNAFVDDDFINAVSLMEAVIRGASGTEVKAVQSVQGALGGQVVSSPENPNFAPVAPPVGAPVATPAPASQAGDRTCAHGTMVKRTGQGQYGEWRGFFCPTPKGTSDQCKPVYLKKSDSAWSSF